MKKCVKLLLAGLLALGVGAVSACDMFGDKNSDSSTSSEEISSVEEISSSIEESSSEEASSSEEDSSSEEACKHNFIYQTIVEASCEKDGAAFGTCTKCGDTEPKVLPATGHTYENGSCKVCGKPSLDDPNDLSTSDCVYNTTFDAWHIPTTLSTQDNVVSTGSTSALRGAFNVKNATDWYTNPQDGRKWVWSVVAIDMVKLYGEATDLSNSTLTFDIKVINGDPSSSIMLLNEDGSLSTQLAFNQSKDKYVSDKDGFSKKVLTEDWVRITADLETLYGADASAVSKIYLFVSNAYGDYINDTVYYLDNMSLTVNEDLTPDPDWPILNAKEPSIFHKIYSLDAITSYKPEGYGAKATLTQATDESFSCIKGTFNNVGVDTYRGEDGGDWVWTFFSIDMPSINDHCNADLRNLALTFKLKVINGSPISSIILYDENGTASQEISFRNDGKESYAKFQVSSSYDGWYDFTINFPLIYDEETLDNVNEIALVFSNAYGNNAVNTTFYIDDIYFDEPTHNWENPDVYNHEGYYNKSESLEVMFAGNSFIEFSASAYWLNAIAQANGANLTATYNWTPNGRIDDQYSKAFNSVDGYITKGARPDVLFIQDFYALDDALDLADFLEALLSVSPFTEVMVYTADNESEDGILAASHYGLDLVNWRAAIHTLKSQHGFTTANLNYPDGATHANELNGVFGAVMAYMQLYGEVPDIDALLETILNTTGREGDNVVDFLPCGSSYEERLETLSIGMRVCATLCGLDPNLICLHNYTYATETEAGCETDGVEVGTCTKCGHEITKAIPAVGHNYTYATATEAGCETDGVEVGTCTRCGGETTRAIPAIGHNYTSIVSVDATCTTEGVLLDVCQNCNDEIPSAIPLAPHVYQDGVCMGCSQNLVCDAKDLVGNSAIYNSTFDAWHIPTDFVVQTGVVSTDSTSALRGTFNVKDASAWHDSPEDGGKWVWSVLTVDLVQLYGQVTDLRKSTLTFDIKVVNGDVTSSMILLKEDGSLSAQLAFNQSSKTGFVSPNTGYSKDILSNGWVRITADFNTLYGTDASAVSKIYILVSNAYGDYVNDTVYYVDNIDVYMPPAFPASPYHFTRYDDVQATLNKGEEAWFKFTNTEYASADYFFAVYPTDYQGLTVEAYNPVTGAKIDVAGYDYDYQFMVQLALGESVYIRITSNSNNNQFMIFIPICNA